MHNPRKLKGKYIAFRDLVINKISRHFESYKVFALCSLIIFVLVLWVVLRPCPTQSEHTIIKTLSAFSVAGLFSLIPNFLKAKTSLSWSNWRIGGSFLVFIILFLVNPAGIVLSDQCSSSHQVSGTILLGGEPLSGAFVRSPELNELDQTNSNGDFNLPFEKEYLDQAITVVVNYKGVTLEQRIDHLTADNSLLINLQDTVASFNDALASTLIKNHLIKRQKQIENEVMKLVRINRGQEISWDRLTQKLVVWQQLGGRVTNNISFKNGIWRLDTQRALENADLITLPLDFYSSWSFQKPTIYLLNWQYSILENQELSTIKLEYVMVENSPLTINTSATLRKRTRTTASIWSDHSSPLRFAHVSLEYSHATNWFKQSNTRLLGHLPNEQYLFEFKNAQWRIIGTAKPSKTS